LKESQGTPDPTQAKTLRNLVAAKFEAMFAAARATGAVKSIADTHEISSAEGLSRIRKYGAQEDALRAEQYAFTDRAVHPACAVTRKIRPLHR
jgi:hypothetical protein